MHCRIFSCILGLHLLDTHSLPTDVSDTATLYYHPTPRTTALNNCEGLADHLDLTPNCGLSFSLINNKADVWGSVFTLHFNSL